MCVGGGLLFLLRVWRRHQSSYLGSFYPILCKPTTPVASVPVSSHYVVCRFGFSSEEFPVIEESKTKPTSRSSFLSLRRGSKSRHGPPQDVLRRYTLFSFVSLNFMYGTLETLGKEV